MRRFSPFAWSAAGVFVLLLARSGLEIAAPLLVGRTVDLLAGHEGSGALPTDYVALVWIVAAVLLVKCGVHYFSVAAASRVGQDLENRLRADLFRHVLALRFTYHDENRSGETIARCLRDMEKARHFFREAWFGYLEIALLVVAVVAVSFWTHWSYGFLMTLLFGGAIAATLRIGGRIGVLDRTVSDDYDHVVSALQENVAGARVVRAFGREPDESRRFGSRMDAFTGAFGAVQHFWTGIMPYVGHVYHAALPLALLVGGLRVASGAGTLGEVAAILLYVRIVHHRIRPLTRLVILGQDAVASAGRVFEVLDRAETLPVARAPRRLPQRGGDVRLEDVWFSYPGGEPVLRGVSLHVPAGGSLGILGPTGAGKSTLAALLPRFYDAQRGRVLLDGIDVRELDPDELRAAVSLVFQESFLFSGTVAENVAYGAPGIARAEVERCVRLAAADDFVAALPQGLETVVGERGVSLSGGQRQRLAIARAIAVDPRVIVFDDATSSVDMATERRLFRGMREAARDRTAIVISQRVSTVRWCDAIAVLEDGVVSAAGPHDRLLGESALYREIARHQELQGALP